MQAIEEVQYFIGIRMARKLNVAVQPAVADARWPTSKMDFRSNEAGRTGSRVERGRIPFLLKPPVVAAGASSRL